jgi:hypothetical protein
MRPPTVILAAASLCKKLRMRKLRFGKLVPMARIPHSGQGESKAIVEPCPAPRRRWSFKRLLLAQLEVWVDWDRERGSSCRMVHQ